MQQISILVVIVFFLRIDVFSQTINFVDLELKKYLINELCVDTTPNNNNGVLFGNGFGDIDVDLNNDNEIQLSEALSIRNLQINDISNNYSIKSIQELNSFPNLEYLKITSNDSIIEIANLNLDSLETLWIGSCPNLKVVDISTLTSLTKDVRIEDIDTLDYLNIQNGNTPQYFSMFYSDNIHYACIDSIASEYQKVAWRMISGFPNIDNCSTLSTNSDNSIDETITIFPNPTRGILELRTNYLIHQISIFDMKGVLMEKLSMPDHKLDLTYLNSGVYLLIIETKSGFIYKKIMKK